MEGLDISKLMENINGNPDKVWKEVDKMMKEMKQPKTGSIEVPIIVTHFSKKESDELNRILHGDDAQEMDVTESESVATISINKITSYHKIELEEGERTVVRMDNGMDYELKLTYDKFKELLSVD